MNDLKLGAALGPITPDSLFDSGFYRECPERYEAVMRNEKALSLDDIKPEVRIFVFNDLLGRVTHEGVVTTSIFTTTNQYLGEVQCFGLRTPSGRVLEVNAAAVGLISYWDEPIKTQFSVHPHWWR